MPVSVILRETLSVCVGLAHAKRGSHSPMTGVSISVLWRDASMLPPSCCACTKWSGDRHHRTSTEGTGRGHDRGNDKGGEDQLSLTKTNANAQASTNTGPNTCTHTRTHTRMCALNAREIAVLALKTPARSPPHAHTHTRIHMHTHTRTQRHALT